MATKQPNRDWVDVVDGAMQRADRLLDRFRKTPRRRLENIPEPPVPADPFAAQASNGANEKNPKEPPLGDPRLVAQVYGRRSCEISARAMSLLRSRSMSARMIDLEDPDNARLENRLIRETKRYEMPWVYLEGEYIGGFSELASRLKQSKR